MILLVERLQDFLRYGFREVGDQVSEIVDLHAFDSGDELLRTHAFEQAITDFLGNLDKYITLEIVVDHLPKYRAILERQGFEQTCKLGWVQAVGHNASGAHAATVELLPEEFEVGFGVLSRVHGRGV